MSPYVMSTMMTRSYLVICAPVTIASVAGGAAVAASPSQRASRSLLCLESNFSQGQSVSARHVAVGERVTRSNAHPRHWQDVDGDVETFLGLSQPYHSIRHRPASVWVGFVVLGWLLLTDMSYAYDMNVVIRQPLIYWCCRVCACLLSCSISH